MSHIGPSRLGRTLVAAPRVGCAIFAHELFAGGALAMRLIERRERLPAEHALAHLLALPRAVAVDRPGTAADQTQEFFQIGARHDDDVIIVADELQPYRDVVRGERDGEISRAEFRH